MTPRILLLTTMNSRTVEKFRSAVVSFICEKKHHHNFFQPSFVIHCTRLSNKSLYNRFLKEIYGKVRVGMKHCLPPIYGPDITAKIGNSAVCRSFVYLKKRLRPHATDGFEIRADLLYAAEALEGTAKREFYRITVRTKRGQCGISHGFGVAESAKACAGGSDDQQS